MLASTHPPRAARRLAAVAALLAAACGDAPIAPPESPASPTDAASGHAILVAAPDAESGDAAAGSPVHADAVLLAVTGASIDSVTAAAGVHAALLRAGDATHLLLTGRFPRGAAERVATVWTASGAAPTITVAQAVGGGTLRQQRPAAFAATVR